jgi:hypothetical protein
MRLPYRQTQGLAKKLSEGLGLKVPNFRRLHYRFKTMKIDRRNFPSPEDLPDEFVIVLDSTDREWLRKKQGKKSGRGWIKLHVAFDLRRKKVVAIEITDERVHDSQKANELVESVKREAKEKGKEVSKVIGDGAYDAHRFFRYLHNNGICAGILVRRGQR